MTWVRHHLRVEDLLLFGWLWGVWGVLLEVPIVVIVKVVSDHVEELEAFSEFLGD